MELLDRLRALPVDLSAVGFGPGDETGGYFCTPEGARVLGWEGCDGIHYCTVDGLGETVFAVNPMPMGEEHVYPLARNLEDFLRLLLAAGSVSALEQIVNWDREQFERYVSESAADDAAIPYPAREASLAAIAGLGLSPMEDVFGYVNALQAGFDATLLRFSAEYYDCKGLENPNRQ